MASSTASGSLNPSAPKSLMPLSCPRIVRRGDDDASVKAVSLRQERDGGSGHNARALDCRACLAQALGKRGGDPRAGFARVAPEKNFGLRRLSCAANERARGRRYRSSLDRAGPLPQRRECRLCRRVCVCRWRSFCRSLASFARFGRVGPAVARRVKRSRRGS